MPIYVWISLVVFAVAICASATLAVLRGLAAWRAFTSFQARTDYALLTLEQSIAGVETRVDRNEQTTARLADAQVRLRESLAAAAVLADALAESRALLAAVRGVLPRK